jgi:hypothetical protein
VTIIVVQLFQFLCFYASFGNSWVVCLPTCSNTKCLKNLLRLCWVGKFSYTLGLQVRPVVDEMSLDRMFIDKLSVDIPM